MLLIVHPKPFESSSSIRQMVNEYGVKESDCKLFGIDTDDGFKKNYNLIKDKVYEEEPTLTWIIGNDIRTAANVHVGFELGHGRYMPIFEGEYLGMLIPSKEMISNMPQKIKEEFNARMLAFKEDWEVQDFDIENRADVRAIRGFADAFGFDEDQELKSEKSFWVMYSGEVENHIITLKKEEHKELWQEHVPFGVKLTGRELKYYMNEGKEVIQDLLWAFGDVTKFKIEG